MDPILAGLRTQDFHESLRDTGVSGPKEVHYHKTLLVGKAASLAMHLRGLQYVGSDTQLRYAAASLGISAFELSHVLRELEKIDFISISRSEDEVKRVDVRVPTFRSGYEELGKLWIDLRPTEVEQASVEALEALCQGPIARDELEGCSSLDDAGFAVMADVMEAGSLLAVQAVDGVPMAYSPLAVDGNPTPYLRWATQFPSEVQSALQALRESQGLPESDHRLGTEALQVAAKTGVLMPVTVSGPNGPRRYYFPPHGGLKKHERTILEKARAVVSCVRYGESFSVGTRIRHPKRLIETLIQDKKFRKGHPDIEKQYGVLVEKLIGHSEREAYGWNFHVLDTEENMRALRLAAEMLERGDTPAARFDYDAQRALVAPNGFVGPTGTRPRLAPIELSSRTSEDVIRSLANLARGAGHDE